jgi:branched-chain amino acid transport system permease protein
VLRSPFGRALQGIKSNEHRMRSLGFPIYRYKLASFTLAGALAGLAGYLSALQFGFVNPELLSWHQSGNVLLMLILGGVGSLYGAVVGAFAFVALTEIFQALTRHWQLLLGGAIILLVIFLPGGSRAWRAGSAARSSATRTMSDPILLTQGLTRRFGGLAAVNGVAIGIEHGRLHAVLGPNGAGKTTLINLLSGDLDASSGSVIYKGEDITRHAADRRSRLGIGRSYQKTNIFPAFTAFENCRLAAQSRMPRALHLLADAVAFRPVVELADGALEAAALPARRARCSGVVPRRAAPARDRNGARHATGGAAARRAACGHGREEAALMVELLRKLAPRHAILLSSTTWTPCSPSPIRLP